MAGQDWGHHFAQLDRIFIVTQGSVSKEEEAQSGCHFERVSSHELLFMFQNANLKFSKKLQDQNKELSYMLCPDTFIPVSPFILIMTFIAKAFRSMHYTHLFGSVVFFNPEQFFSISCTRMSSVSSFKKHHFVDCN